MNFIKKIITVSGLLLFIGSGVHAQDTPKAKPIKSNTRILYGMASYYSNKFNGRKTANGEIFSQSKYTCACNVLPLGTWIKVTNLRNGKSVIVKTRVKIEVIGKKQPKI